LSTVNKVIFISGILLISSSITVSGPFLKSSPKSNPSLSLIPSGCISSTANVKIKSLLNG
jgi:hypothetical protein